MSIFLFKSVSEGESKRAPLSVKKWLGSNLQTSLVNKENLQNLMPLISLAFTDPSNLKEPFRQIILVEEIVKDQFDRVKDKICKTYLFREQDKCMILEIGKKNSIGIFEIRPHVELTMLYQRAKLMPAKWNSIDFGIQQIKLRGKQNAFIFYDEFSFGKNAQMDNLIKKYFLNPNIPQ